MSKASGQLAKDAFTGALVLHEGGRGEVDDISVDLDMKTLDIDALMGELDGGKKTKRNITALPLQMELTGVNLQATVASELLTLAALRLPAARFDGRLAAGNVTLRGLSFALAGGTVNASGSLKQTEEGGHLALNASLTEAEGDELAQLLGARGGDIRGRLEGGATINIIGAALMTGHEAAIVAMNDGDVARDLIEQVSTDLRNLFHEGEGRRGPVACLLGVLTLKDGVGTLSPLRLASHEATVVGVGSIDFARHRLDLTVKTESDTTGLFALDVPIVVNGPFSTSRDAAGRQRAWHR